MNAPYQRHSGTSREAAERIVGNLSRLQAQVYEWLFHRRLHGATDEEIQEGLKMNPSTQRPRRIELLRKGVIHAVKGPEGKRLTRSGRKAQVWAV